jgi:hypothetical protein
MKTGTTVTFRCDPADLSIWQLRAEELGMTLSSLIRGALNGAIRLERKVSSRPHFTAKQQQLIDRGYTATYDNNGKITGFNAPRREEGDGESV